MPRARRREIALIAARASSHWSMLHQAHDGRNIIVYSPGQSGGGYLTPESKQAIFSRHGSISSLSLPISGIFHAPKPKKKVAGAAGAVRSI